MVKLLHSKELIDKDTAARLMSSYVPPSPSISTTARIIHQNAVSWDEAGVVEWLEKLGLSHHGSSFVHHHVDGRLLLELDDEDLQELGVTSQLQRKLILTRREALRA